MKFPQSSSDITSAIGYLHPDFAQSYAELGRIQTFTKCGMHFLERKIDDTHSDLCGLYPYSMATKWAGLEKEIDEFSRTQTNCVSLVFVTDPFVDPHTVLDQSFWDVFREFKSHVVVDLRDDWKQNLSKEDRRLIRRSLETHRVDFSPACSADADVLWGLYQNTIERFQLKGVSRLSRDCIESQLLSPGARLVKVLDSQGVAGGMLSFLHGKTAVAHLSFLSERAVSQSTSHALIYSTLNMLQDLGAERVTLGGSAGSSDAKEHGLFRYKQRWSKQTSTTYLVGKVLQPSLYNQLTSAENFKTDHFPSYRAEQSATVTSSIVGGSE